MMTVDTLENSIIEPIYYFEKQKTKFERNLDYGTSIVKIDNNYYTIKEDTVSQITVEEIDKLDGIAVAEALQNKRIHKNVCSLNHLSKIVKYSLAEYQGEIVRTELVKFLDKKVNTFFNKFVNHKIMVSGVHLNSDRCIIRNIVNKSAEKELKYLFELDNLDFYDTKFNIEFTLHLV